MRNVTMILLFSMLSIALHGQIPVHIDSVYRFIKRNSIHSNHPRWADIDKGYKEKLESATTDLDTIRSLVYVFEQLNDVHSSIQYNGRRFSHYPAFDDATLQYLIPLVKLSGERTGIFSAKIVSENLLYLQVPGIQAWGDDVSIQAQRLSDTVCKYLSEEIRGVILDLRLNDGGQFASMASGLALLFGENYIGGGVNNENKQLIRFSIRNNNLWINQHQMTTVRHTKNTNLSGLPVAVLIGPNTRSSGSILAISFIGRENTVLIGDSTANGYTTGNDYFSFGSNLFLNLSTSNSIDRNNNVYPLCVPPDIITRGREDFYTVENDERVKAAISWLKNIID